MNFGGEKNCSISQILSCWMFSKFQKLTVIEKILFPPAGGVWVFPQWNGALPSAKTLHNGLRPLTHQWVAAATRGASAPLGWVSCQRTGQREQDLNRQPLSQPPEPQWNCPVFDWAGSTIARLYPHHVRAQWHWRDAAFLPPTSLKSSTENRGNGCIRWVKHWFIETMTLPQQKEKQTSIHQSW